MNNLKTLLALLLVCSMLFTFAACGGESGNDGGNTPAETDPVVVTEPEPTIAPVTIGDITIEFDDAVLYSPYNDDYFNLLVYFNITNNSDEPVKPGKIVFAQVLANGKSMTAGVSFQEDVRPELDNSFYNEIAPGETVRCMEAFGGIYEDGKQIHGVYEITIMDMYHQIEDKLVITIDTAELETVTEA